MGATASSSLTHETSSSGRPPTSRLPLFVLPRVQFPATKGTLNVYEARYVAMFEELGRGPAEGRRFGHIAAMPDRDTGTVAYGVECRCTRMVRTGAGPSDGSAAPALVVTYESGQRFKLLSRADDGGREDGEVGGGSSGGEDPRPRWPVGDVVWVRDAPVRLEDFQGVMRLEHELWALLLSVSELTERLHEGMPTVLPATLRSLSPPGARSKMDGASLQGVDESQLSPTDPRMRNRATHDSMTMWAASGAKGTLESTHGDCSRQELFSFAVSSLIDTTALDEDPAFPDGQSLDEDDDESEDKGEAQEKGSTEAEDGRAGDGRGAGGESGVAGVPRLWEADEAFGLTGEAAVRHAVLTLRDTRTRLQWAKASILPHLRHLEAQLAVEQALGRP